MVKVVTFQMPVTAAVLLASRFGQGRASLRYEVQQVATGRQSLAAGQNYAYTTNLGMSCFVSLALSSKLRPNAKYRPNDWPE
jgi:hypothetical protein